MHPGSAAAIHKFQGTIQSVYSALQTWTRPVKIDYLLSMSEGSTVTTGKIGDIGRAISQRFGPFLALFGSATAVSALLLAAGFLSDFGAYHVASLPRLHFSLTALAETGAEILIDTVALMIASPWRAMLMLIILVALLLAWALRDRHETLKRLAHSVGAYRTVRLAVFVFAVLILGSVVDRVQTSLSGEDRSAAAVEYALRGAYANHFPDPWEREFAIERKTYELRFFPLPNLGARLDRTWDDLWSQAANWTGIYWLKSSDGDNDITGIPLRRLPEAREEARHIFGWVALFVVLLVALNGLLRWWGGSVGDTTRAETETPTNAEANTEDGGDTYGADSVGRLRRRWWGSLRSWEDLLALNGWASPIERILSPLTAFMTVIAIILLPLLHGVLARTALGGETVMVFTTGNNKAYSDDEPSDGKEGLGATATGGCASETLKAVKQKEQALDEALREALQAHPAHQESESQAALTKYRERTRDLSESVLAAKCPDAVALMWSARPSMGTASHKPELAEFFWSELRRVSDVLRVQIGVILGYPREGQSLSLVDSVVPPREAISGQWSVLELAAGQIRHTVVLPDILRRRFANVDAQVRARSDHDSIQEILVKPGEQSFEVVLKLLKDNVLHAHTVGVATTTLGSMAYVASRDRPRLTREAIDLLLDLAKPTPSAFWPRKSIALRGAAVTSLMLSQSPYAAYRLAEALDAESEIKDCMPSSERALPLRCIDQTPSAAGLLMDALSVEQRFLHGAPSPLLTQTRDKLLNYLISAMEMEGVEDDVRGATCTAINLAGRLPYITEQQREKFWHAMSEGSFTKRPFSSGACILAIWPLGVETEEHRTWLRDVAMGTHPGLGGQSGLEARDKELIRVAALSVLGKQGVSGEEALVFDIYSQPMRSDLREIAESLLDETNSTDMAALLFNCGEDKTADLSQRVRCVKGISKLHQSYKGDDQKAAERSRDLAHDTDPLIRAAACSLLGEFKNRGGKWVLRNEESDETIAGCFKGGSKLDALLQSLPEEKRREVRKMLQALSPEERTALESTLSDRITPSPQPIPNAVGPLKAF